MYSCKNIKYTKYNFTWPGETEKSTTMILDLNTFFLRMYGKNYPKICKEIEDLNTLTKDFTEFSFRTKQL